MISPDIVQNSNNESKQTLCTCLDSCAFHLMIHLIYNGCFVHAGSLARSIQEVPRFICLESVRSCYDLCQSARTLTLSSCTTHSCHSRSRHHRSRIRAIEGCSRIGRHRIMPNYSCEFTYISTTFHHAMQRKLYM